MNMKSLLSSPEQEPITEETIYTGSYHKFQEHYFKELSEAAKTQEYPSQTNILGRSFFIFENKKDEVDQSEKKDGKEYMDSLLFFHPAGALAEDFQERLVGIIQAFIIQTKENSSEDDLPEIIGLLDGKIGLCFYEDFVFCVGFDVEVPDKLILFHLKKLHEGLVFFNGYFKKRNEFDLEYKNIIQLIGKEMAIFYEKLSSSSLSLFRSLPFYNLPYKNNSIFIYASQLLDSLSEKDPYYLGGSILYDKQIVCNSITENILYWIIHKANNLNLFSNSLEEENMEEDFFFKNFESQDDEINSRDSTDNLVKITEGDHHTINETIFSNENWFRTNVNTSYRRKTNQNIKRLFKSLVNRVHGQLVFGKEDISDFSLVYVPYEQLINLREEFREEKTKKKKEKKYLMEMEEKKKSLKKGDVKKAGELILMVIEKVENICLIRLFEVKKFEQKNLFQKSIREKLLSLKVKIEDTIDDKKKYINKQGVKIIENSLKEKEKIIIYQKDDQNLEGNYYHKNKMFFKLHHLLKDEEITKVVIKQNDKMFYAKNIFNSHIFYELSKEGNDNNEEKNDLNISDFEKKVHKRIREGYKMNLL